MSWKSFFMAWLFSALVMMGASYLWHGILLNDLARINYPKEIYFLGSVITYLLLGFVLTNIYLLKYPNVISKKPMIRGILSGAALGAVAYLFAIVIGISFSSHLTLQYIVFDMAWQLTEQILGGITVGAIYIASFEGNFLLVVSRKLFGGGH
jgi:hypothetical protein